MKIIEFEPIVSRNKTIMIFTEGTILKPRSWRYLYSHKSYIPIGNAPDLIGLWKSQGANIIYCTSHRGAQAHVMANLLKKYSFPGSQLISRDSGEKYKDMVEQVKPDMLIEDDCRSIGGSWQLCITKVREDIKENIKSIIVPEFKGISHLPEDIVDLGKVRNF